MKQPKRRSDSFLGMHFDFHARPGETVPSVYDPGSYIEALDAVKPDYIQCDTKGHPGLSSYPTKVGNRANLAPGIDLLKMLREATAERGIALYAHYSGVYDMKAAEIHPDWAIVDAEGNPSKAYMSVFGPYLEELLIPQILEIAGDYGLNGIWVDGDNWAHCVDYSHWAVEAYRKATGQEPAKPGEEGYIAYRDFCREGFKQYVRRYISAVHEKYPDFQVTSNWIFSSKMSEKADVPVEFLSGDTAPMNAVNDASFQGHFFEARNMPWDLMMWGFQNVGTDWNLLDKQTKSLVQHCQEAAMIISMGGGFEFYNIQYGHGGVIQRWMIPTWKELAKFAREREICHKGKIRREVGVLIPFERNEEVKTVFTPSDATRAAIQWIFALQEMQYSTKVVFEYQLEEKELADYQLIVVPASAHLAPASVKRLGDFVANGGRLLVDGPCAGFFQDIADFKCSISAAPKLFFVEANGKLAQGESRKVSFEAPSDNLEKTLYRANYCDGQPEPSYFHSALGKGELAVLAFDLAATYKNCKTETMRAFLRGIIEKRLGFTPAIRVTGTPFVQDIVLEKDGKLLVNLINMAGDHAVKEIRQFEEIPPIGPITVTLSPKIRFNKAHLVPEEKTLQAKELANGSHQLVIDRLDIHTVIVLE
ncbi:MAG: alpha-L-fucosidase [Victivallales bacterium]|nr:alpha-L-fucosidase [Victivallales bacterium]